MLQKLQAIKEHWEAVERELSNPATVNDMKRFAKLNKEYKDLGKIVEKYNVYKNVVSNIESNKEILATEKDKELLEMAKEELDVLLEQKEEKEETTEKMVRSEYQFRSFKRNFTLTDKIDTAGITATYTDGILSISLPKAEPNQATTRKIDIV